MKVKYFQCVIGLFFFFSPHILYATSIDVYAEGHYSETNFTLDLFADIYPSVDGPVISAGVKVNFPIAKLQNPVATKNEYDWYLGSHSSPLPYLAPQEGVGEVVFLVARLDQSLPLGGVYGDRILLGRLVFDRIAESAVPVPADFTLGEGRPLAFVDFATVHGIALDGTAVSYAFSEIYSEAEYSLKCIIRILNALALLDTDAVVRVAEHDRTGNHLVGLEDVLYLLREASEL